MLTSTLAKLNHPTIQRFSQSLSSIHPSISPSKLFTFPSLSLFRFRFRWMGIRQDADVRTDITNLVKTTRTVRRAQR